MAKTTTKTRTAGVDMPQEAPTDNLPAPRSRTVAAIVPQSWQEITAIASAICRGGMAPKSYCKTDNYGKLVIADGKPVADPDKVAVAIMHGMEVGLTPMASLQSIAVINGMPSLYGDGLLAVIRASGLLEDIEETIVYDEADVPLSATCKMWRKGQKTPSIQTYTRADAVKAKLWGKAGPWTDHQGRMLQWRARGWCGRDGFADVLRGLHVAEEVQDMVDVTSQGRAYTDAPAAEPKRDDPKYQSEPAAKVSPTEASTGAAASAGQAEAPTSAAGGFPTTTPPAGQPQQSKPVTVGYRIVDDLSEQETEMGKPAQKAAPKTEQGAAAGQSEADGVGRRVIGRLAGGDGEKVAAKDMNETIPDEPYEITFTKKATFRELIDFSVTYLKTPGRTIEQANAWYDYYRKQLEYGLGRQYPESSPVKMEVKKLISFYNEIIA